MGLETGIVAVWGCRDASGTSLADLSGKGHTGTLGGSGIPTWVTNAIQVNGNTSGGISSHVTVPTSADFNLGNGDFTLQFSVLSNNTSLYYSVIDFGYSNLVMLVEFQVTSPTTTTLRIYFGATQIFIAALSMNTGTEYLFHIRRTSQLLELFQNGVLIGNDGGHSTVLIQPPGVIYIGSYSGGEALDGTLREIILRKGYALTNAEITKIYNGGNTLLYPYPAGNFFKFFN